MALRHTEEAMARAPMSSQARNACGVRWGHGRDIRYDHAVPRSAATVRHPPKAPGAGQPGAARAHREARARRSEPHRGHDYALRRVDDVRLPARHLVRLLDRVRRRELPVRPADDDRLARGDLPLDVRDDQPEPRRRQASGHRRPAMAHGAGGGRPEPAAARDLRADPRPHEGGPRVRVRGLGGGGRRRRRAGRAQRSGPPVSAAGTVAAAPRIRCGDHLDLALTAAPHRREASPRGFHRVAAAFFVLQVGGTLPVPLYILWKARLGFGTGTLTLVFAVYALGTLTSLLLLAPLSDQIGRRPALLTAVGLAAVSTALFLVADGVAVLFAARFLSGMAVAMKTATGTAALRELAPAGRERRASVTATALNMGGLALGPLLAGLLAEYGGDATRLVFWVYLGLLLPAAAAIVSSSETVRTAAHVVVRPRRLAVPPGARGEFAIAAAAIFCAFTVLGLFSSLVPSFLATSLHEHNHAVAGGVAAAIFAVATAVQVVLGRLSPGQALGIGLPVLIGGLALVEGGLRTEALGVFLAGTAASGIGVGLSFMASTAIVNRIAPPGRRAELMAATCGSGYCGQTIPVVAIGATRGWIGTADATLACAIATAALAAATLVVASGMRRAGAPAVA